MSTTPDLRATVLSAWKANNRVTAYLIWHLPDNLWATPTGARDCQQRRMIDIILWRRLDLPGHEIGRLDTLEGGWRLSGTAVFAHDRRPCKLEYLVTCDAGWRTNSAHISGVIGDHEIDLRVSVDGDRRWRLNGVEHATVQGCLDIDLGFSPSTNLLPIRRLALPVGKEAEVKAAWLPFPSLEFELLSQVYRREGERTYRYESGHGAFVRTLEVNGVGFVTSYPGLWQAE